MHCLSFCLDLHGSLCGVRTHNILFIYSAKDSQQPIEYSQSPSHHPVDGWMLHINLRQLGREMVQLTRGVVVA